MICVSCFSRVPENSSAPHILVDVSQSNHQFPSKVVQVLQVGCKLKWVSLNL